jgi:23S rRNA (cytidine1920-2'-O)/16S rRNA (cytidine1409-2'-O)-methyltransferase
MRLLDWLLEAGLVEEERSARGLILRGDVLVNDRPVTSAAHQLAASDLVRLRQGAARIGLKGSRKLRPALQRCGMTVSDLACLDLGASTGGFTTVLLEQGARLVYAVDVGYGLILPQLRADPRVRLLERQNARLLTREQLPEAPQRAVGDLSFVSWAAVLPVVAPLLDPQAELLLLVKPQFELAAAGLGGTLEAGIARQPQLVLDCLQGLYNTWAACQAAPQSVMPCLERGAKGNQEYFVHFKLGQPLPSSSLYDGMVSAALLEAGQ